MMRSAWGNAVGRVALFATLLSAQLSAAQLWDKASEGMSRAQLLAVYGSSLRREKKSAEHYDYDIAFTLNKMICGARFAASFYFDTRTDKLALVELGGKAAPENVIITRSCILESLTEKYGQPILSDDSGTVWKGKSVRITLTELELTNFYIIRYEPRHNSAL